MKIADVIKVLDQVRQLYASAGAKGPAADFEKFIDILKTRTEYDIGKFLAQVREGLERPKQKKTRAKTKAKATSTTDFDIGAVTYYVEQLKGIGANQVAFDRLFEALSADKRLGLGELTAIAHEYSGGVIKFKSASAARTDISKTFIRQARFLNKLI
jgi:hypothetical protein